MGMDGKPVQLFAVVSEVLQQMIKHY